MLLNRHTISVLAAICLIVMSLTAWIKLSSAHARSPDYDGRLAVMLPWHWSAKTRIEIILDAGGMPIRESTIPGVVEIDRADRWTIERLDDAGALFIVAGLPTSWLALGGCSYLSLNDYELHPATAKIHAGPL